METLASLLSPSSVFGLPLTALATASLISILASFRFGWASVTGGLLINLGIATWASWMAAEQFDPTSYRDKFEAARQADGIGFVFVIYLIYAVPAFVLSSAIAIHRTLSRRRRERGYRYI